LKRIFNARNARANQLENDENELEVRDNLAVSKFMAECEWIVLCDYAFPAMSGKLCLIGIFDVIFTRGLPAKHERAAIGFNIIGEPGEQVHLKLEIIRPTGGVILNANQDLTLPDSGAAQLKIELKDLPLFDLGRHAIQLDLGGGQTKSAWFTVTLLPESVRPPD
jgi:hypothetical protein